MPTTHLAQILLVSGVAFLAACATPQKPPMRIAAAADHVVVRVDGEGSVTGFADQLACDPTNASTIAQTERRAACEAHRAEVAIPHLVATPAPGWAFARWETQPLEASLAEGSVRSLRYTAVFVRDREIASGP